MYELKDFNFNNTRVKPSFLPLPSSGSMAAANAGQIEVAHLGPIDDSVLTLQIEHLSEAIWNGWLWVPNKKNRPAHIFKDRYHEQITSMLPGQRPSTTERPSTSTTPVERGFRPLVATPQVVPTPNPSPSTRHPSPSLNIPSPIPHPSLSPNIPSPTPLPSPAPNIPPPIPHLCPGSDIPPPTPQSFPKLSLISSFDLSIDPTPPDMHTEPPSHSTSTGPSSSIDPPNVQAKQAVGLPVELEGRLKHISKEPPCETRGHKHRHRAEHEAADEGHARPPPPHSKYYMRQHKVVPYGSVPLKTYALTPCIWLRAQSFLIRRLTPCSGSKSNFIAGECLYLGDKEKEKLDTIKARRILSSAMAKCCPAQMRGPTPNGMYTNQYIYLLFSSCEPCQRQASGQHKFQVLQYELVVATLDLRPTASRSMLQTLQLSHNQLVLEQGFSFGEPMVLHLKSESHGQIEDLALCIDRKAFPSLRKCICLLPLQHQDGSCAIFVCCQVRT
ncbi:hypothetical protein CFP56_031965 [Quercus suber]|uniref:Uncharacterized protein n=1 Tax=Quercus suber TaxID=58331 RepID=A0AAW0JJ23_QUESU